MKSDKNTARAIARARLQDGHRAWVRINDTTTPQWERDLEALTGLDTLAGVMLTKAGSAEQVAATTARLSERIPIVAMIENAAGREDARTIAHSPATLRLAFGSSDFRQDTGAGDDPAALAYARSRMVSSAASNGSMLRSTARHTPTPTGISARVSRSERLPR